MGWLEPPFRDLCSGYDSPWAARWEGWFGFRFLPGMSAVALSPALSTGPRWLLELWGSPQKPGQEEGGPSGRRRE